MKQILVILCSLLFVNAKFYASNVNVPNHKTSVYKHLSEVNNQWKNFNLQNFEEQIIFESDIDRIQYHLLQVEKVLRNTTSGNFTQKQLLNRNNMLNVLHQYAIDKVFPINLYHSTRQPYFIDHLGTHCAVGFLLKSSGFGEIANDISSSQNYAYVNEIESNELLIWAEQFGFELKELALIQPTYPDETPYYPIGGGTNGVITKINGDANNFIIGGAFTELDNLLCLNVGKYVNGNLECLGDGIDGIVNEIERTASDKITVYGKFDYLGNSFPIAIWDETILEWEFVSIPNLEDCEVLATDLGNYRMFSIKTASGEFQIHKLTNDIYWNLVCETNGPVLVIEKLYSEYYLGGNFNQVSIGEVSGVTYTTQNLIHFDEYNNIWSPYNVNIPDTVNVIKVIGNNTFVGGSASNLPGHSIVLLSQIANGSAISLLQLWTNEFQQFKAIYDLEYNLNNPNRLQLFGNLQSIETGWSMIMGRGAFNYNLVNGQIVSAGWFDYAIRSAISTNNGDLIVAGDFTAGYNTDFSHLAKSTQILGIEDFSFATNLSVYPNPSTSTISIDGMSVGESCTYQITDVQGKIWKSIQTINPTVDVSDLSEGIYFLNVQNDKNINSTIRFVKN